MEMAANARVRLAVGAAPEGMRHELSKLYGVLYCVAHPDNMSAATAIMITIFNLPTTDLIVLTFMLTSLIFRGLVAVLVKYGNQLAANKVID
jgi:hypothetical protein